MRRQNWQRCLMTIAALAITHLASADSIWIAGGNMGTIDNIRGLGKGQLHGQAVAASARLLGAGSAELKADRSWTDRQGNTHIKMQQMLNGMEVVGGDVILHARDNGRIYALGGGFVRGASAPRKAKLNRQDAVAAALGSIGQLDAEVDWLGDLTYVVNEDERISLAWPVDIRYYDERGLHIDTVFADARKAGVAAIHPKVKHAKNRETYDSQNGNTQGVLVCTESSGCPSGDPAVDDAHDYAGVTYDYFQQKFGRDSLDDNGMTLISSVHFCPSSTQCPYANAGWTGAQMIYGDGGSFGWGYMSKALDVVAHELTHGVTDFTSDLVYSSESGALNEAMSDIHGESTEIWAQGTANKWELGEDLGGEVLRFMDDPTQDGYSTDYYPERLYPRGKGCNQFNDNCGVHGNSGIANLAYALLVDGGTHPRGKTSNVVPGIGIDKAEQIFYRANTNYFTSRTKFSQAANMTQTAASDLYGQAEVDACAEAWCAVGVGDCSGDPGGGCTDLLPKGASCSSGSECCSGNCKGKPGQQTCK